MDFKVLDICMSKSENLGFTISGHIDTYLRVANVKSNGPAFMAGLKNGDNILMINGSQIHNRDDIIKSLRESNDTLKIRVIRQNLAVQEDISIPPRIKNKFLMRRLSVQADNSLHKEILQNMGSRIGMEITRAHPETLKPISNRIKYFEKSITEIVKDNNGSYRRSTLNPKQNNQERALSVCYDSINKSNSYQDIPNFPRPLNKVKNIKKSPNAPIKPYSDAHNISESNLSSSSPNRFNMTSLREAVDAKDAPVLNLSLRKKSKIEKMYANQSLTNLSSFSKSYQNIPFSIDIEGPARSYNTNSTTSLFDDDCYNSHITEYQIDWKAIYSKVSSITINDIEKELISYFTNSHTNLQNFPVNVMYRYITFNGVLGVVFNRILSPDTEVDFHEEIMKIPNEIYDIDYDMNSYDIVNLIRHNVKKMGGQVREYIDRKSDLNLDKEKLKISLGEHLSSSQDAMKMRRQIDRIYKTLYELSNFLTSMVIAMSMWKFSKDFSHLYENISYQDSILTTSETLLLEFSRSQKILERNMVNLFRRFKYENLDEVLKLFDTLFSETLDLSICIPIFHDKLKRDNEMLAHLENGGIRDTRKMQFV